MNDSGAKFDGIMLQVSAIKNVTEQWSSSGATIESHGDNGLPASDDCDSQTVRDDAEMSIVSDECNLSYGDAEAVVAQHALPGGRCALVTPAILYG